MESVNDYAPAEIEQIIVQSLVPSMSSILLTGIREWMLNCDPFL
jgi:hypothetical protein